MHEVGTRAGPQHHVGTPEVFWNVFALEYGTVGDMAGDARLAVADNAIADARPHAVAADQRTASRALAVFEGERDAIAVVLVTVDAPAGFQRDQVAGLAGFEKRGVDIGAMGDRVRLPETL